MINKKTQAGSLNVIVMGTGMYVCGRGTDGYGTIMPALFEWAKDNRIGKVCVVGNTPGGAREAAGRIKDISKKAGVRLPVEVLSGGSKNNFGAYRKTLDRMTKPACAIIAVPDALHAETAALAMKAGIPVLVVKPLAPTLKEVYFLARLQQKTGVYGAVEFHKRLDLANLKLRDAIRSGAIGDPLYFLAEFSQRKSMPSKVFRKWVRTTNIFQYLGIHYVDIVYFATGARPLRAMAVGQKGWLVSQGIDTYDSIEATVEWELPSGRKFVSYILTNWIDPESTSAMSDQKIKVIGTKGRFESDQKRRGVMMVTDENGMEEPNPYFSAAYGPEGMVEFRGYGIDSIHRFLDDVVQIEKGDVKAGDLEDKRPTFGQSVIPTAVLEAVNKSLKRRGEWVAIERAKRG